MFYGFVSQPCSRNAIVTKVLRLVSAGTLYYFHACHFDKLRQQEIDLHEIKTAASGEIVAGMSSIREKTPE
jgi:hypothetical protein